ncbi:unnamed protein product [Linum tenue]|uniref:Uncharacterized protein n=1 Tax=Linum tenue TaxID=586396 RepID=A0AAV0MM11_9ROSI|nr:unnamed protein product [Linum tenue]
MADFMNGLPKSEEQDDVPKPPPRLCDYCNQATAVLYCRADSARLCLACDREVHSTNQLFTKHTRWLLCDACDASPASIFCETERSVLCQNCDWETHRHSFSSLHSRRPIDGFSDCPSVNELMGLLGFEDLGVKSKNGLMILGEEDNDGLVGSVPDESDLVDGYSEFLVWESPPVGSIDDLIVSVDSGRDLKALGVPPLPKNRNAACGRYKEEIIRQLRRMARLEPQLNSEKGEFDHTGSLGSLAPEQNSLQTSTGCEPHAVVLIQEHVFHWHNDNEDAANQAFVSSILRANLDEHSETPDKQSNAAGEGTFANDGDEAAQPHHPATTLPATALKVTAYELLNSQERDSAISRYKEKKKTRRYDKHIRYESRKARAESRTRIRGRFAKIE